MSIPANILSDFHTYSYHQTLIMCNSWETAADLSDQTDLTAYRRDGESSADPYTVRQLGNDSTRQYVILIDTATDVRFSLKMAKWATVIAPMNESNGMKYSDTQELDGELHIVEPYGIQLYEVMSNAARNLRTDPSGLFYVLKTVFVGRHTDGTEEMISTVRPFTFTLTDITSVIDHSGTTYKLEVIGSSNGTAKLPQHQAAGEKISLAIEPGDTVGSMMDKLQAKIRAKYDRHKVETFRAINATSGISSSELSNRFQDVLYTFSADPVYYKPEYAMTGTKGTLESNHIHSGPKGTIETMIRRIIGACEQCDKDGTAKNAEGIRFVHKIISSPIRSNAGKLEIGHEIHRFEIKTQSTDGEIIDPQPGESIEFDYIYTGRNTDVLELDIKMDFGLSFFQTLSNAKHIPSTATEDVQGIAPPQTGTGPGLAPTNSTVNQSIQTQGRNGIPQTRTPLFLSTGIKDPWVQNKVDPLTAASFEAALTKHASIEHVTAIIKIHGNPNLLDELLTPPTEAGVSPREGNTGAANVTRTPALVKLNIKFPNNSDFEFDASTNSGVRDFWYRGFYNIYSIENSFDEGLFVQTIEMFNVPVSENAGIDKASQPASNFTTPPALEPTVLGRVCSTGGFPYEIIAGVRGNPNVDDNFIAKVEDIAAQLGTLPEWLMATMSFETGGTFSPGAKNPQSSATGLIQFIESTAQALGTSTAALRTMTAFEQLTFVHRYFAGSQFRGRLTSLEGVYTAVLRGRATPNPNEVMFTRGQRTYTVNAPLDFNDDGTITSGEATTVVATRLFTSVNTIHTALQRSDIPEASKTALRRGVINQAFLDAIRDYQSVNGLTVTGFLNDETGRLMLGLTDGSNECDPIASPIVTEDEPVVDEDTPINQRNNNPTNIRKTPPNATKWTGEVASDNPFAKFSDVPYGLRAAYILLRRAYFTNQGLTTVSEIINRWAPVSDNSIASVASYVASVSLAAGVGPNDRLNILTDDDQLIAMVRAMARHEGGTKFQDYPESVYRDGLALL